MLYWTRTQGIFEHTRREEREENTNTVEPRISRMGTDELIYFFLRALRPFAVNLF